MPFKTPHFFDELIGTTYPTPARPTLLIGAGLSYSLVPLPWQIVNSLEPEQGRIEKELGISDCTPIDPKNDRALYIWAEEVYAKLVINGSDENSAKLAIAKVLKVTTDPCWSAKAKMPLRGTAARHRVIARLAREGRWHSLWSLNWDVWLERALESVGVEPSNEKSSAQSPLPVNWVRWFETWVPPNLIKNSSRQTVIVYKPHGCVDALLKGDGIFILTEKELVSSLEAQPQAVRTELEQCFTHHSLITAGWSAGEPYLVEFFSKLTPQRLPKACLTIIDPKPNEIGHASLRFAYGSAEDSSICSFEANNFPTADDVFLWLQVRHGLECLRNISTGNDALKIEYWLDEFKIPNERNTRLGYLVDWFDCYLPVWNRLCFNNGQQRFREGGEIAIDVIPTHRRDEHIPWSDQGAERRDLTAARNFLLKLDGKIDAHPTLDFAMFPGAIWNGRSQHLIVPVPAWDLSGDQSLAALKPLVESRHWANQGNIKKVSILGLSHKTAPDAVPAYCRDNWAYELSRLMQFSSFARSQNIGWLSLDDWEAEV